MLFRLFILNFYNFWILNQSSMVFCNLDSYSHNQLEYIINVFNYIRQQDGWDLKLTYKIRINEKTYQKYQLKHILTEVDKYNFKKKITMISELIIFRYTESLKIFRHLLSCFVEKCYTYRKYDAINFIDCSKKLRTAVINLNPMFRKLLYAVVFLSNINDYLYIHYKLKLVSIVKHIGLLYSLTNKKLPEYDDTYMANKMVGSIKKIICNALDNRIIVELDHINRYSLYFNSYSVDATLVVKYSIDPKLKITKDTVDELVEIFDLYTVVTIQDEYEGLGFDKLIVSDTKERIEQQILNYNKNIEEDIEKDVEEDLEEGEFIPDSEFRYDKY
ncbi:uncharacterized protein LOC126903369 [Daktulosphaira vitifoliae]|uniref:uncharacterized protein LOC126903369 n=1 Tax=Daktulosphaira vitifoliae TaxID=58002 RepID=UPI0021AA8AAD|nr:uncharacterized protein LOC126903369 [Daktulosphaira vitifoliae]